MQCHSPLLSKKLQKKLNNSHVFNTFMEIEDIEHQLNKKKQRKTLSKKGVSPEKMCIFAPVFPARVFAGRCEEAFVKSEK